MGAFSLSASPDAEWDHGYGYGNYGISRPSIPAGGYAGYRPYYGKRSAEPDAEADPLHYYAPASYPYFYRPKNAASGYAGPLPGNSYQSVHRLHKREAEADAQFGPLTPAFGDAVSCSFILLL